MFRFVGLCFVGVFVLVGCGSGGVSVEDVDVSVVDVDVVVGPPDGFVSLAVVDSEVWGFLERDGFVHVRVVFDMDVEDVSGLSDDEKAVYYGKVMGFNERFMSSFSYSDVQNSVVFSDVPEIHVFVTLEGLSAVANSGFVRSVSVVPVFGGNTFNFDE